MSSAETLRDRWKTLTRCVCDGARLMVGQGNYDAYAAHVRRTHPDREPMTPTEFFRERQNARYGVGGRGGFRCC